MRRHGVSLLVMLFPARYASRPAADEVTERLLAGRETPPGADASERALSRVLTAAARPGTEDELAGEAGAVAAFLLAAGPPAASQAQRARTRPRLIPGRVPVLAGGLAITIFVGLYGAAAANALPTPMQRWAHSVSVLHVPAPAPAETGTPPGITRPASGQSGVPTDTPTSSPTVPTGQPASKTPTPGSNGNGNGNGNGNAGNGNAGNGNGNGNAGSGNNGNGNGNGNAGSGNNGNGKGNGAG